MTTIGPMRILIVRLSAVGDTVHGLPVLSALRDHLPNAYLSWVVEERAAAVLEGHPALDRLIVAPRRWLRSPMAVWRLTRQMRAVRPQIAIDLQGLTKSAVAARLSGAPVRIGATSPDGREFSTWLNNRLVSQTGTHVVDRYLELLGPLGISRPAVRFDVPRQAADEFSMGRFVRERGLGGGFALLNPGAGWVSKRWPIERFAAVARHLGRNRRLPSVVVWAGAQERAWADQIITTSSGFAHMAPPTSLGELAELARRARLFVGSDTGPLHLAAAVGTPCVGLYGPVSALKNGPYGAAHIAIQRMLVEGSSRERREASDESMRAIEITDVCNAADRLLGQQEPQPSIPPWNSIPWATSASAA
ncbi:MAG TPA: glycosyltransferase family 9 protein [Pirellulales bacterium]|jgi:lipopolysaccharide heptosyltransferase I|nr:glycosyltransferase family 9 protein [Pirellulales bacterium]